MVDVCAEGIVEWAMEPLDTRNASRLDELLNGAPAGADLDSWENYREKMWEVASLRRSQEQVDKYGIYTDSLTSLTPFARVSPS